MQPQQLHSSHPKVFNRLKRADRHWQNVITTHIDGRSCFDVLQQGQTVKRAIHAAVKTLIHDHLDHCLDAALGEQSKRPAPPMNEFKTIAKHL